MEPSITLHEHLHLDLGHRPLLVEVPLFRDPQERRAARRARTRAALKTFVIMQRLLEQELDFRPVHPPH